MPPDASGVENILPLLRRFSQLVDLHVIFLHVRPEYDKQLIQLHDSLTKMIDDTGIYLKTPVGTSGGRRRFLVVIEPLLDPAQTNARVYGADYVVVASPVNGTIHMREVRHAYLHYQIEPLLYARATALDRLLPFLKTVRDAPLDYTYKSDVVALVIECMIRAIEARTMDTGRHHLQNSRRHPPQRSGGGYPRAQCLGRGRGSGTAEGRSTSHGTRLCAHRILL